MSLKSTKCAACVENAKTCDLSFSAVKLKIIRSESLQAWKKLVSARINLEEKEIRVRDANIEASKARTHYSECKGKVYDWDDKERKMTEQEWRHCSEMEAEEATSATDSPRTMIEHEFRGDSAGLEQDDVDVIRNGAELEPDGNMCTPYPFGFANSVIGDPIFPLETLSSLAN